MTAQRKLLGNQGEDIACSYLKHAGAQVLERNWKCQSGDADIIAREGEDLVFLEVKTRSSEATGLPEDAVNRRKRQRYERIAMEYLFTHDLPSMRVRFDVLALVISSEGKTFLRHHRDAWCGGE